MPTFTLKIKVWIYDAFQVKFEWYMHSQKESFRESSILTSDKHFSRYLLLSEISKFPILATNMKLYVVQ